MVVEDIQFYFCPNIDAITSRTSCYAMKKAPLYTIHRYLCMVAQGPPKGVEENQSEDHWDTKLRLFFWASSLAVRMNRDLLCSSDVGKKCT